MWYKITDDLLRRIKGGDKSDLDMLRRFVAANGFTRYSRVGAQDWGRFLRYGRDMFGYPHIVTECPPYMDHERTFKNTRTGTVCLTYQPYEHAVGSEIIAWAKERGLVAEIHAPLHSWYYPGWTSLVVIHLPGVEIKLE